MRPSRTEQSGHHARHKRRIASRILRDSAANRIAGGGAQRQTQHEDGQRPARLVAGNRSPINDEEAGAQVASPTPTASRRPAIWQKFCAMPEAAVSKLQTKTPPARIMRAIATVGHAPSGTPMAAYSTRKAVPNQPSAVSLKLPFLAHDSPTAPRMLRSKKFIMLMANKMHSAKTGPVRGFISRLPRPVLDREIEIASVTAAGDRIATPVTPARAAAETS